MNIYVGNLSREVTEDDLRQAFEGVGKVESVNIVKDRFSSESRGFGFVMMSSQEEARSAISSLNGTDLKGRNIAVNEARPRTPTRRSPGGGKREDFGEGRGDRGGRDSRGGGRRY